MWATALDAEARYRKQPLCKVKRADLLLAHDIGVTTSVPTPPLRSRSAGFVSTSMRGHSRLGGQGRPHRGPRGRPEDLAHHTDWRRYQLSRSGGHRGALGGLLPRGGLEPPCMVQEPPQPATSRSFHRIARTYGRQGSDGAAAWYPTFHPHSKKTDQMGELMQSVRLVTPSGLPTAVLEGHEEGSRDLLSQGGATRRDLHSSSTWRSATPLPPPQGNSGKAQVYHCSPLSDPRPQDRTLLADDMNWWRQASVAPKPAASHWHQAFTSVGQRLSDPLHGKDSFILPRCLCMQPIVAASVSQSPSFQPK